MARRPARMETWPGTHAGGLPPTRRQAGSHGAPPGRRRGTGTAAEPAAARRIGEGLGMSAPGGGHRPVLLDRVLALLAPALDRAGAVLVDATLGRAGHAQALLDAHPGLVLIGLDTDAAAVEASRRLLARYPDRVTVVRAVFNQ